MPRTNADSSLPPVGWIGLGEMGLPMSANLVAAGHTVYGFDLDPDKRAAAAEAGVRIVDSTAELVERGELLVSMLRTGVQTEALLLGEGGRRRSSTAGGPRDVVVMSTLDPPAMERLADECAAHGLTIFDVPVSGGVRGAEAATLSIMASGDPAGLERIRPLLEPLACPHPPARGPSRDEPGGEARQPGDDGGGDRRAPTRRSAWPPTTAWSRAR